MLGRRLGVWWIISIVLYHGLIEGPLTNLIGEYAKYFSEVLIFGGSVFWLTYLLVNGIQLKVVLGPLFRPAMLFCLYLAFQAVILEVHPVVTLYIARAFSRPILLMMLTAIIAATSWSNFLLIKKVLIATGALLAGLTVLQYFLKDLQLWYYLRPHEDILGELLYFQSDDRVYPSVTFAFYADLASFLLPLSLWFIARLTFLEGLRRPDRILSFLMAAGCFFTCDRKTQMILLFLVCAFIGMGKGVRKALMPFILLLLLFISFFFGQSISGVAPWEGTVIERYLSVFSPAYWEVVKAAGEQERMYTALLGTAGTLRNNPLMGTGFGTIGTALTDSAIVSNPYARYESFNRLSWVERGGVQSLRYLSDVGWVCLFSQGGLIGMALIAAWIWHLANVFLPLCKSGSGRFLGIPAMGLISAFMLLNCAKSAFMDKSFSTTFGITLGLIIAEAWLRGFLLNYRMKACLPSGEIVSTTGVASRSA